MDNFEVYAIANAAKSTGEINTINDAIFSSSFMKNGIYRDKDLTNIYTVEEIYEKVHDGSFDDLFLGDYFTVSITTTLPDETVKTENVQLMIAAFNYYYNIGDTALTTPHVVLIPRNQGFSTANKMNETNTTEGGYLNSYMHQTLLPCYAASLRTALNDHLITHRSWLTKSINATSPSMAGAGMTGAANNCDWATVDLQLMNEVQVYGTTVWSSSAYDVGIDNRKLPVFDFITPIQFGRFYTWLRSVVSSTSFAACSSGGFAIANSATYAIGVRPLIVFG